MGPTASGKSALAAALARRFPVEIVSVDSAQVYRGMDVGTAKPTAAERARVPHHLIDILDPTAAYSAARFRADALAAVRGIAARGNLPLLVGGTMLYFKALREGLSRPAAADPPDCARRSKPRRGSAAGRRCTRSSRGSIRTTAARLKSDRCPAHPARARDLAHRPACRCRGCSADAPAPRRCASCSSRSCRATARPSTGASRRGSTGCSPTVLSQSSRRCAALRARRRTAVDALCGLPAGVGASGGRIRRRDPARPRDLRDAPARKAPAHLAALDARTSSSSTASIPISRRAPPTSWPALREATAA